MTNPCKTPGCIKVAAQYGYCTSCRKRLFIVGMSPSDYLQGVAGVCAIPGCSATGDLQLDHDNTCCARKLAAGRCGACNRGFVCRKHNLALRWIESIDHWEYLEDPASSPFVTYLLFWRAHPRISKRLLPLKGE